jgi:Zn-dependent peptidase ImmA (M78 family)
MKLERGFKSWAERTALSLRGELGLHPHSPLDAWKLGKYLEVEFCTPQEIQGIQQSVLDQLLKHDPSGWSAVGIYGPGKRLVIYNPTRSRGRQGSDVMHELAHLILDHKPATLVMSHDGKIAMRSFDRDQEDEANWLGWCLLLPRSALLYCVRSGLDLKDICDQYGVSEPLVKFRIGVTGVRAQARASRRLAGLG